METSSRSQGVRQAKERGEMTGKAAPDRIETAENVVSPDLDRAPRATARPSVIEICSMTLRAKSSGFRAERQLDSARRWIPGDCSPRARTKRQISRRFSFEGSWRRKTSNDGTCIVAINLKVRWGARASRLLGSASRRTLVVVSRPDSGRRDADRCSRDGRAPHSDNHGSWVEDVAEAASP